MADRTNRSQRAAEVLQQQRAAERRRNFMRGGIIAAVLAALVVVGVVVARNNQVEAPKGSEYAATMGDPEAEHTLVVYEDFLCPACGAFEAVTNEPLEQLADDGNVFVEYRPFELLSSSGDYSARSTAAFGVVLEEEGNDVAKEFHDLLFEAQPEEGDEPYPDAEWLVEKAVEAGAEEDAVRAGIEEGENDFSAAATAEAAQAKVTRTPTVLLDGELFNGNDEELFEALQ